MQEKKLTQKKLSGFVEKFNQNVNSSNDKRKKNKKTKAIFEVPHPFLKWAGGKRQLIPQMDRYFPISFNKYIEPFVGGGAIFFHLCPKNAILIDSNKDLIKCYEIIKKSVFELIESLQKHKNESEYYYRIRNVDRNLEEFEKWSDVEKASRIIYMNRCCYNGLYRVNSKGQFNVPFGKYKNPKFCDSENLIAVHEALKNTELVHGDFEICLNYAEKNDFIYLDPPYHPLSNTANFTSYTAETFGKDSQKKLFEIFKKLDERGCKLLLSNSYNDFIINLYKEYEKIILNANRAINCDANKRGYIKEVLILNNFN